MLCAEAKKTLKFKLIGDKKFPDNETLSELFYEAMLFIANKCVPSELLRTAAEPDKVYRNLERGHFVCFPDRPNFGSDVEHLMIDESLAYAAINEVAFLLSGEPIYHSLALEIIAEYNANYGRELE